MAVAMDTHLMSRVDSGPEDCRLCFRHRAEYKEGRGPTKSVKLRKEFRSRNGVWSVVEGDRNVFRVSDPLQSGSEPELSASPAKLRPERSGRQSALRPLQPKCPGERSPLDSRAPAHNSVDARAEAAQD